MRHVKKFEDYDLGPRFSEDVFDSEEDKMDDSSKGSEEECETCESEPEAENVILNTDDKSGEITKTDDERSWGDESLLKIESVKSFKSFISENKKQKKVTYKESGLKHPEKADLDGDKKLSEWELSRGKAIEDAIESKEKEDESKA
jgi:hypothetical protein